GFGKVVDAMFEVARKQGAIFHFNAPVQSIAVGDNRAHSVIVSGEEVSCDAVVATADYHHVEAELMPSQYRNYDESYWEKKTFAPSCLICYVGVNKRIHNLLHHTLFFENDLLQHSAEIYKNPRWPSHPLFYVCCPSKSDDRVAPPGHENLFLLMPVASGLEAHSSSREKYFTEMIRRIEKHTGEDILPYIDYKKSYCIDDFVSDYHAYKGNAYGLANTLMQTANLKPKIRNRNIRNL